VARVAGQRSVTVAEVRSSVPAQEVALLGRSGGRDGAWATGWGGRAAADRRAGETFFRDRWPATPVFWVGSATVGDSVAVISASPPLSAVKMIPGRLQDYPHEQVDHVPEFPQLPLGGRDPRLFGLPGGLFGLPGSLALLDLLGQVLGLAPPANILLSDLPALADAEIVVRSGASLFAMPTQFRRTSVVPLIEGCPAR
jgi:hypothetical protein